MGQLQAGAGRVDITPPVGIAHAGWGSQTHQRAEAVDMPLLCTALVLASDGLEVAIVDLDLIWVMPELDAAMREAIQVETGIKPENVRISFSHTHSGPILDFTWMTEGDELIVPYVSTLPKKVAAAVAEGRRNLRPARVGAGKGACAINVNRRAPKPDGTLFCGRNWKGFVDREVAVVAIDDREGRPIATIVNYACHGTIIGPPNRSLTPDFPGPMREIVERNIGGTCLFLQGAAGNVGPVDGFTKDVAVYHRAGRRLGLEAARVRIEIDPIAREERLVRVIPSGADLGIYEDVPIREPDDTLAVSNSRLQIPVKEYPPVDRAKAEFDALKVELMRVREGGAGEQIAAAVWPVRRAELALHHAKLFGGGKVDLWVQAIRVGGVALVGVPLEPFAEIGAAVKRASPAPHTLFSGYSNGYYGYMPTAEAYPLGGYEVRTSPYPPDAAERVVKACLEALGRLWR